MQGRGGMGVAHSLDAVSILVVEDDPDTRELYRMMLQAAGADVRCAVSVEAARSLLETWRPDVILCDLHLPTVDGCALVRELKADPQLASIPVISISGGHPAVEQARSRDAGFATHLVKPSKLAELVDTLARLHVR